MDRSETRPNIYIRIKDGLRDNAFYYPFEETIVGVYCPKMIILCALFLFYLTKFIFFNFFLYLIIVDRLYTLVNKLYNIINRFN